MALCNQLSSLVELCNFYVPLLINGWMILDYGQFFPSTVAESMQIVSHMNTLIRLIADKIAFLVNSMESLIDDKMKLDHGNLLLE